MDANSMKEVAEFAKSLRATVAARALLKRRLLAGARKHRMQDMAFIPLIPGVFLFQFKTQSELTRTFLRFQEHYESPEFRGKVFGLAEFKAWYRTTRKHGRFSYYSDWGGFNFPSHIVEPFVEGRFKNLTAREKRVLQLLKPHKGQKYYVVGGFGDLKDERRLNNTLSTLHHEVGHALFYSDASYRKQVERILKNSHAATLRKMRKHLLEMGYHDAVIRDEIHAYFLSGWVGFVRDGVIKLNAANRETIRKLSVLFLRKLKQRLHDR